MIAAVICLGAVAVVLACVLGALVHAQGRERQEWGAERRALVDRAIARHAGEVIGLDRQQRTTTDQREPAPVIEGLN